jgi:tRNA(Ile2) C34 agmatinyltransferase TiaS
VANDRERDERKAADLRAAMEEVIEGLGEEVTAWQAAHPQATFDELEIMGQQTRKKYGEALMQALVAQREEVRPVPGPCCAECGTEMHYKGQKQRRVVSSIGETEVQRGYYYCPKCHRGVFPPG